MKQFIRLLTCSFVAIAAKVLCPSHTAPARTAVVTLQDLYASVRSSPVPLVDLQFFDCGIAATAEGMLDSRVRQ